MTSCSTASRNWKVASLPCQHTAEADERAARLLQRRQARDALPAEVGSRMSRSCAPCWWSGHFSTTWAVSGTRQRRGCSPHSTRPHGCPSARAPGSRTLCLRGQSVSAASPAAAAEHPQACPALLASAQSCVQQRTAVAGAPVRPAARAGRTGQVGVAGQRRAAVPRQLYLGHHLDEALPGVGHDLAHLRREHSLAAALGWRQAGAEQALWQAPSAGQAWAAEYAAGQLWAAGGGTRRAAAVRACAEPGARQRAGAGASP